MATLDFFCNRPTVVALIEFGSQISDSPGTTASSPAKATEENDTKGSTEAAVPRDVVKGLLGRGKSRVVFRLKLNMESARISVNKEDGTQLGMLVQDEFRFELKVIFADLCTLYERDYQPSLTLYTANAFHEHLLYAVATIIKYVAPV